MSHTPTEAIDLLVAAGQTVATCESLTGGMICAALTSVPGSSEAVRGGLITYATDLKTALAGVDPELIRVHTVVSGEVAEAMARGTRQVCSADWAVAVTGVAGPGPSHHVPAGTVWLSVVGPKLGSTVLLCEEGDRADVRAEVVHAAINLLCELLAASRGLGTDPGHESPTQAGLPPTMGSGKVD